MLIKIRDKFRFWLKSNTITETLYTHMVGIWPLLIFITEELFSMQYKVKLQKVFFFL